MPVSKAACWVGAPDALGAAGPFGSLFGGADAVVARLAEGGKVPLGAARLVSGSEEGATVAVVDALSDAPAPDHAVERVVRNVAIVALATTIASTLARPTITPRLRAGDTFGDGEPETSSAPGTKRAGRLEGGSGGGSTTPCTFTGVAESAGADA